MNLKFVNLTGKKRGYFRIRAQYWKPYYHFYSNQNRRQCYLRARVAQLVEQLICNQRVAGSTPVSGSILFSGGVPERSKGTDCKSVGKAFGGSNPPPTTNLKAS
jgi:hypothetical protein